MRPLSEYMFGTLKYIDNHEVTLETLQMIHGGTLGSLLDQSRRYLQRVGSGPKARIVLSDAGREAMLKYQNASLNQRQHPGPITAHCADLLRVARMSRVFQMPNKGHRRKAKAS